MITPHKYLNLKNSTLNISSKILYYLKKSNKNKLLYKKLYDKIYENIGDSTKYVFIEALNLLFLLGKIKYDQYTDELELII